MRFPLLPVIVLLLFNGLVDLCVYRIIRRTYRQRLLARIQAVSAVIFALSLVVTICLPKRGGDDASLLWVMWSLYAYLTVYIPKYIFLVFHLLAKLPQLWHGRLFRPLSLFGAGMGAVVFVLMWWGALVNRYNIDVNRVDVPVAGLPQSFEGFTIAQISDLHVGTYGDDTAFVSDLVDRVNALRPDIIVFTGDMVNRHSDEFEPFITVLSRLHAPYGVYSVMGNHDYGDYKDWPTPEAKEADVSALKAMEGRAGLYMLNNEHVILRGSDANDSIALIGVENIGDPPFKVYGSLDKAYPDVSDPVVKVLLSHNPAHWEADIEDRDTNIALTLTGHTHAMQCELFGLSPAALRYDKWGGLYTDSRGQDMYVNIGAGTVGMPYRIGATPEITLLTLKRQ